MARSLTIAEEQGRIRDGIGSRWRWLIGLVLLVLVSWQILNGGDWAAWWTSLQQAWRQQGTLSWLLVTLLFMPLNWLLETVKWRSILRLFWSASWLDAGRAVLAGISVSLVTPNRVGEYGGRVLLAPREKAGVVVWSSLVASFCQWLVFIACGWPALVWLAGDQWTWPVNRLVAVALLGPVLSIGLLAMAPRAAGYIRTWNGHWKWWRWLRFQLRNLPGLSTPQLFQATAWAFLRYVIYVLQYYCLLRFFGLELAWSEGVMGICAIFLIQAGIPLPPGLGVLTRFELAWLLWGAISVHAAAIMAATLSLFLINLALPSLLGMYLIVKK